MRNVMIQLHHNDTVLLFIKYLEQIKLFHDLLQKNLIKFVFMNLELISFINFAVIDSS